MGQATPSEVKARVTSEAQQEVEAESSTESEPEKNRESHDPSALTLNDLAKHVEAKDKAAK